MTTYSPWSEAAAHADIEIKFQQMDDDLGWWDPDSRTIVLATGQTQAERRSTLAHELAHAERGDESVQHVSPLLAIRQEIAASVMAARRLIPLATLITALLWSQDECELAEELHVDVDTVKIRLLTLTPEEHQVVDETLWKAEGRIA